MEKIKEKEKGTKVGKVVKIQRSSINFGNFSLRFFHISFPKKKFEEILLKPYQKSLYK